MSVKIGDWYMVKPKVLVIDDEKMVRNLVEKALSPNCDVIVAENGVEGLDMFHEHQPQVIILDIVMPEMDGITFLKKLKPQIDDPYEVIVVTGVDFGTNKEIISECYELGISSFIHKPMNMLELQEAVKRSVELKRLHAERKLHNDEIERLNRELEQKVFERTKDLESEIRLRVQAENEQSELLESTLKGTIQVMVDILALISPAAFNRARRMRDYVSQLVDKLQLDSSWKYELAAMLSQIGCVTIPNITFQKFLDGANLSDREKQILDAYPEVARKLLINIPKLEDVAQMISCYHELAGRCDDGACCTDDVIAKGGELIRIALDFDDLLCHNVKPDKAIKIMKNNEQAGYDQEVLELLLGINIREFPARESAVKAVLISELYDGMILQEDIVAKDGSLVAANGLEVNRILLRRLLNFLHEDMIEDLPVKTYSPKERL